MLAGLVVAATTLTGTGYKNKAVLLVIVPLVSMISEQRYAFLTHIIYIEYQLPVVTNNSVHYSYGIFESDKGPSFVD